MDYFATVRGPQGLYIPVVEFYELVKNGCAHCSTVIDKYDADEIVWASRNSPLCPDCSGSFSEQGFNMVGK